MLKYRVKVLDIVDECSGTKTYYLTKPEDFTWEEGSHTHLAINGFDAGETPDKNLVHHMSVSTLPTENKIGITTRVPGSSSIFKKELSQIKVGDEMILFKIDNRMALRRKEKPVVLASMGVGIATMRPLIHTFLNDDQQIPHLYNINVDARDQKVFQEEFDRLENEKFSNHWTTSRDSFYKELNKIAELEDAIYYVVGSDSFIKNTAKHLMSKQIELDHIILDRREAQIDMLINFSK